MCFCCILLGLTLGFVHMSTMYSMNNAAQASNSDYQKYLPVYLCIHIPLLLSCSLAILPNEQQRTNPPLS
jgi:hypothetical protein